MNGTQKAEVLKRLLLLINVKLSGVSFFGPFGTVLELGDPGFGAASRS
jgi:hypothetical protein